MKEGTTPETFWSRNVLRKCFRDPWLNALLPPRLIDYGVLTLWEQALLWRIYKFSTIWKIKDCVLEQWPWRSFLCAFCRFVTKLLEDLVFFVVDIPNNGQDVLEIMVNKPNRERQKLMREQNILKQVGFSSVPHFSLLGVLKRHVLHLKMTFCRLRMTLQWENNVRICHFLDVLSDVM